MPIIELINATIYQNNKSILENLNIEVAKGDFVFLIGRTGSGKSSLIRLLYGDIALKKGIGNVVGFDLLKIRQKQIPFLRRKIGIVFQDFKLLPDRNIYNNLEFVLKATGWKDKQAIRKRIEEVLALVGVNENPKKYPFELSGGEQQRVALARASVSRPKLLLADEPTGNLDETNGAAIIDLLFGLRDRHGATLVMVTHSNDLAARCDRVVRLRDGRIDGSAA